MNSSPHSCATRAVTGRNARGEVGHVLEGLHLLRL